MISKTTIHHTLQVYNINLIIAAIAHCTRCEPADTPYDHIGLRPVNPIPKEIEIPLPRDGNGGSLPESGNGKPGLKPVDDPSTEPRTGTAAPVNEAVRKDIRPAKSPVSGKEMTLAATYRPVNYRREDFVVDHHHYHCADSGQSFTDEALDAINQDAAAERYRAKYRIPSAEEIQKIREGHGLSTDAMAALLGIGNSTYRRYESGSIPQLSTARLIQLAASRQNLEVLAELADIDIGVHMDVLEE